MFGIVMMAALAGSGEAAAYSGGCWYGAGVYEHGYGHAWPIVYTAGGVVPLPNWTPPARNPEDEKTWADYLAILDGYERDEMAYVWDHATPEAKRKLLTKLTEVREAAAKYRAKIEAERAAERAKEENRSLSDGEITRWDRHLETLKGDPKTDAVKKWKEADNRGKRLILKTLGQDSKEQD